MKKIVKALSLLLVALLLFSCVSCGEEEKENSKTYKSLREHLMAEGKVVANFIRDMKFKYGDARINPAINWEFLDESKAINPDEKIVSCDRLVGWILYRVGFTSQPYDQGITVWPMPDWCEDMGFDLITDKNDLREGDIVFVNPDSQYRPAHVFMCASTMRDDGKFLRYDGGSNERLQCVKGTELVAGEQPFLEPIHNFMYAYRPNDLMLDHSYEADADDYEPIVTAEPLKVGFTADIKNGTPTIDAVISENEYSTSFVMDRSTCSAWQGTIGDSKATIYLAWNDGGLCFAAKVADSTPGYRGDDETWVGADCVQIAVDPGKMLCGTYTDGIFFTFGAKEDGSVVTYRHNYDAGIISDKVTAKAAGHVAGSEEYIIEAFIPWEEMKLTVGKADTSKFEAKENAIINILPCVIDSETDGKTIICAYKFINTTFSTVNFVPGKLVK